eukprot:COSAG01_NODE_264_length_19971_cov_62.193923_9_plen_178_part_00
MEQVVRPPVLQPSSSELSGLPTAQSAPRAASLHLALGHLRANSSPASTETARAAPLCTPPPRCAAPAVAGALSPAGTMKCVSGGGRGQQQQQQRRVVHSAPQPLQLCRSTPPIDNRMLRFGLDTINRSVESEVEAQGRHSTSRLLHPPLRHQAAHGAASADPLTARSLKPRPAAARR